MHLIKLQNSFCSLEYTQKQHEWGGDDGTNLIFIKRSLSLFNNFIKVVGKKLNKQTNIVSLKFNHKTREIISPRFVAECIYLYKNQLLSFGFYDP